VATRRLAKPHELAEVKQLEPFRRFERPTQASGGDRAREVEQRARNRRHRDRVANGPLLVAELASAVDRDARPIAAVTTGAIVQHDDLDARVRDLGDPPKRRCAAMAESGAFAAGEHGGHPPAALRQAVVARGVDAEMERMQPPAP
jgi:hypothetical protein